MTVAVFEVLGKGRVRATHRFPFNQGPKDIPQTPTHPTQAPIPPPFEVRPSILVQSHAAFPMVDPVILLSVLAWIVSGIAHVPAISTASEVE